MHKTKQEKEAPGSGPVPLEVSFFTLESVSESKIKLFMALERGSYETHKAAPSEPGQVNLTLTLGQYFLPLLEMILSPFKKNWKENHQGLTSTRKLITVHSLKNIFNKTSDFKWIH